jgi:phosphoribosyl-dephospho-CoA transferase
MDITVHDLLRLRGPEELVNYDQAPQWVSEALSRAPWVVVRRASFERELIPVGVRGRSRSERFAGFADPSSIEESVRPEELISSQAWKRAVRFEEVPAMGLLPLINEDLRMLDLCWGPVGSIGFELASGLPVANRESDLDLIVRMNDIVIPRATTEKLLAIARGFQVDLLVETPVGGVSLLEYATVRQNLMLRTVKGPSLIPHPASMSTDGANGL